ncbi:hypothetical protein [uncultured Marinobacter sp.]|uniref:hypothetical protein n=1 Tax=uncultured Marinobacter sp. TaxID=187379 RepID=UPI0030DB0A3A
MKRLFYLAENIDSVQSISDDLHAHDVSDWRFHIVSRDEAGLYTHRLHTASVLDRTDLARYLERGAIIGAVIGVVAILVLAFITGMQWPMAAWIALFLFATAAGAWAGGFGGIGAENYRIRRFHSDIEAGKYLLMIDVPQKHLADMKRLMMLNHPEARLQGVDSSFNQPFGTTGQPRSM